MAKLDIQTLTDEYLENKPLSLTHAECRENVRGTAKLSSCISKAVTEETTLPKTVSRIAGPRSSVLRYFFLCIVLTKTKVN